MVIRTTFMEGAYDAPIQISNTCERKIHTHRGDYLVQASWPLTWTADGEPLPGAPPIDSSTITVIYLVDGNAYFLSATEAARRIEFTLSKTPVIIVGIGYPNSNYVYDPRRGSDLTPPVKSGGHDHLFGMDGQVQHYPRPGGAKQFLEIIEDKIIPLVQKEFFPYLQLERSTKVLFGHSYGGLFTLYTLFTNTELFDMYVAASPSIWYDDCSIVYEYEGPFLKRRLRTKPCLFMGYGALEQNIHKLPHESEEDFLRRKQQAEELAMKDNAVNMFHRLQSSGKLGMMTLEEFYDEDHSGAATCGLHRGFKWLMNLRNQ